jgi:urease gamma subunit
MRLTEREFENLKISHAGMVAQKRLARGIRLNYPEAVALITAQCLELIRDGKHSLSDIQQQAKKMLGKNLVLSGVPQMIKEIHIEATFPDGVKVVSRTSNDRCDAFVHSFTGYHTKSDLYGYG